MEEEAKDQRKGGRRRMRIMGRTRRGKGGGGE